MTSLFLSQSRLDEKARQRPRTPPVRERVPSAPAQTDARTLAALEHRAARLFNFPPGSREAFMQFSCRV